MRRSRIILRFVLAAALVAGAPGAAFAGLVASVDCPMMSSVDHHDGCCDTHGSMARCQVACAVSFAAAIGKALDLAVEEGAGAPLARLEAAHPPVIRPPDTAPPKSSA